MSVIVPFSNKGLRGEHRTFICTPPRGCVHVLRTTGYACHRMAYAVLMIDDSFNLVLFWLVLRVRVGFSRAKIIMTWLFGI